MKFDTTGGKAPALYSPASPQRQPQRKGPKRKKAASQADGEIAEVVVNGPRQRNGSKRKVASEAVNDEVHARKRAKQHGAEEARCLLDAESE